MAVNGGEMGWTSSRHGETRNVNTFWPTEGEGKRHPRNRHPDGRVVGIKGIKEGVEVWTAVTSFQTWASVITVMNLRAENF